MAASVSVEGSPPRSRVSGQRLSWFLIIRALINAYLPCVVQTCATDSPSDVVCARSDSPIEDDATASSQPPFIYERATAAIRRNGNRSRDEAFHRSTKTPRSHFVPPTQFHREPHGRRPTDVLRTEHRRPRWRISLRAGTGTTKCYCARMARQHLWIFAYHDILEVHAEETNCNILGIMLRAYNTSSALKGSGASRRQRMMQCGVTTIRQRYGGSARVRYSTFWALQRRTWR